MQLRPLSIIVLLAACAPKSSTTDSDGGSSSSATEGASVTSDTAPATSTGGSLSDTAPTSDPGPTTVPATASSTPTDTDVSASDSTTGGPPGGLPGACSAVCAHWDTCSPGSVGSLADCKAGCIDGFEDPPECTTAMTVQWECVAGLSCEEALKFLDGDPTSCIEELINTDDACTSDECGGEIGGDMETCTLEQDCGTGKQQYDCEADVCTCIQDGEPGKQCPSNDFCSTSHEEQHAAITACCGWDWGF